MLSFAIKPGDKLIKGYYEVLGEMSQLHIDHEMAVRDAFRSVLAGYARKNQWTFVSEFTLPTDKAHKIIVDGIVLDSIKQKMGFWEAKDERDDLDREIKRKIECGYPTTNIIFQAPEKAVLFQKGIRQGLNTDITSPKNLVELLKTFFEYRPANYDEWKHAIDEFKARLPEISAGVEALIEKERHGNKEFIKAFESFYALCRQAINPNLTAEAVERMLVQHLLTERIFRRIFNNPDFTRKNVIAAEVEKVVDSLTHRAFNREAFLASLDHYYRAIEHAAENTETYAERQDLLNTVYERFFQGYSPKEADTHGIVYTPQPIVDFMVRSVEDILKKEFGRSLASRDVHILDPFVGTGNFIVRVMRQIAESDKGALPWKYANELHCNEVMLLPYYIASMNIEHEFMEQVGEYQPFDGICLVDTFELAEPEQGGLEFMTEENTARIQKQKQAPIFVVLGNPPYNMQQVSENDQNANRKYAHLDQRIQQTYTRASAASLRSKLSDPYVKAFRFATDRLRDDGIVCFVTNNGFLDQIAFDGMRKCLAADYTDLYFLDLGGNVRANPKISGTTHNVFGIKVGVSVSLLVKKKSTTEERGRIFYHQMPSLWKRNKRYDELQRASSCFHVDWEVLSADKNGNWLTADQRPEFDEFVLVGDKQTKGLPNQTTVFDLFSLGLATNRDKWVYSFSRETLLDNVQKTIAAYVQRGVEIRNALVNAFSMSEDDTRIKWTDRLLEAAKNNVPLKLSPDRVTTALYRPFTKHFIYFDTLLIQRRYQQHRIFPHDGSENIALCVNDIGSRDPVSVIATVHLPDLHVASSDGFQCFPFYTYSEDGTHRRENITDWALEQFRSHYRDRSISKWDIFHYVYAVLHHPEYRSRYAANLKRELPRVPFLSGSAGVSPATERSDSVSSEGHGFSRAETGASENPASAAAGKSSRILAPPTSAAKAARKSNPSGAAEAAPLRSTSGVEVFRQLVAAGKRLADIHVHYEQQPEFPLEKIWNPQAKLDYRVTKMRLSKDKTTLFYNDALTLKDIPPQVFDYRLGNRSALEWVIDQYQVSTDKRSGITNDPNRADDPAYILRLIGQVVTVSLETVQIVNALPEFVIEETTVAAATH